MSSIGHVHWVDRRSHKMSIPLSFHETWLAGKILFPSKSDLYRIFQSCLMTHLRDISPKKHGDAARNWEVCCGKWWPDVGIPGSWDWNQHHQWVKVMGDPYSPIFTMVVSNVSILNWPNLDDFGVPPFQEISIRWFLRFNNQSLRSYPLAMTVVGKQQWFCNDPTIKHGILYCPSMMG